MEELILRYKEIVEKRDIADDTLVLLYLIDDAGDLATPEVIHRVLGLIGTTYSRRIKMLRDQYGVDIRFIRRAPGKGFYRISDWGVFDRESLVVYVEEKFPKIRRAAVLLNPPLEDMMQPPPGMM